MSLVRSAARRSALVALVAGGVLAGFVTSGTSHPVTEATTPVAAKRVGTYTPVTEATFNDPLGTSAQQRAIFSHLNDTIDSTPAGATIRIAVFSFAEKATADRLIAAYRRGVNVQLIFDDHIVYPQESRLRSVIGANVNARSFVKLCHKSCRGSGGQMHDKMFLFSQAGQASNVVMIGSDNITRHNAVAQWSDVYTVVDDPALYYNSAGVFDQMKYDRPVQTPYFSSDINSYQQQFFPYAGTTQATDPLSLILSKVTCLGTTTETQTDDSGNETTVDVPVTTSLRISQHAWNGSRGKYLARTVAGLEQQGCDVEVIYGVGMGAAVKSILAGAGVQMSPGTHKGVRTHQKTMLLSGIYDGDPNARIVWTGSHNWSNGALTRDEIIFRIDGQEAYDQYAANFDDIWNRG